jgi:hypothetical protein
LKNETLEEKNRTRPKGAAAAKEAPALQAFETVEKDHGRIETRRYYLSDCLDWFADRAKWEGLASVSMVESIREINSQAMVEQRYFPSS